MAKVGLTAPYLRQNRYGYYWEPSRRIRRLGFAAEALGKDLKAALRRAAALNDSVQAALADGPGLPQTVSEGTIAWAVQRYQASNAWKALAPKTQKNYRKALTHVLRWGGEEHVGDVSRKAVKVWQEVLEANAPSFAATILKVFRVIMHFARDLGYKIDNFDKLKLHSGGGDGEPWTDFEISAYCDQARQMGRPSMALAATLAVCLGQREGDVIRLPRSAYDSVAMTMTLTQHKTKKRLTIPVLPELRLAIERAPIAGIQFVISEHSRRPYGEDNFRRVHREICRAAGISDERLFMHFRHTAATRLGEAGCSDKEIQAITGHSSDEVKRYVRPNVVMANAAITRFEEHRRKR